MKPLTINELKEKINNGDNFLLDLYATWCGPCKVMLSNLENISESLETKSIGVYKLDIDGGDLEDRNYLINELAIRSVPTIKLFKEGKQVFSRSGVMSGHELLTQVDNLING